ncbi:MAG: GMC-type oxidoreductase [Hyperionvirus sp.]|uniref:GMC-type oxidoreductase n=1 Tax=Hyperionvirus sp. TaxID=2487770 RepID=A0A3G5AB91_9VIRU|nr:MAG: GMC-type oxidoreductase [Hyperionvirus sp.]
MTEEQQYNIGFFNRPPPPGMKMILDKKKGFIHVPITDIPAMIRPSTKDSRKKTKFCDKKNVALSQKDFDGGGLILDQPNVGYYLTENVVFSPTAPLKSAITILADDVDIDLMNFKIMGGNENAYIGIDIGREFETDLINCTLSNGLIQNFVTAGIWDNGSTNSRISCVRISDINNIGFIAGGIVGIGCRDIKIKNCSIADIKLSSGQAFAVFGIFLPGSIATIRNCNVSNCISNTGAAGIEIYNDDELPLIGPNISDCHIDRIIGSNEGNVLGIGIIGFPSTGGIDHAVVNQCTISGIHNAMINGNAYGVLCQVGKGTAISNSDVSDVSAVSKSQGGDASGFRNIFNEVSYCNCKTTGIRAIVIRPSPGI